MNICKFNLSKNMPWGLQWHLSTFHMIVFDSEACQIVLCQTKNPFAGQHIVMQLHWLTAMFLLLSLLVGSWTLITHLFIL